MCIRDRAFEFVLSLTRSKLSPGSKYCSFDWLVKLPYAEPISKTISPICTTKGPIFPIKPLLAEIWLLNLYVFQPLFLSSKSTIDIKSPSWLIGWLDVNCSLLNFFSLLYSTHFNEAFNEGICLLKLQDAREMQRRINVNKNQKLVYIWSNCSFKTFSPSKNPKMGVLSKLSI